MKPLGKGLYRESIQAENGGMREKLSPGGKAHSRQRTHSKYKDSECSPVVNLGFF